ncbi:bifunctional ADP-dependent NAD(P)H-hydrate dehydratase/NAD(P)H-hydrate epimerase [Paenibacillus sp. P46E]|uniref:bifunctional ADP-dependent NAD(P)H-hydrate dehydratase/NAD(P)H-hydrate epimerase n=1 Tax=Paenibacillus sp. P46E TaxID=1349436 RepID=UPI00093EBDB4|nr:bifunctional ADP-dependent NAD(P)H-hydrate dehydratase/NAD(P)H-hydrate epimerase [Paenibacillus sp. P46E]OKQ00046.1 bifunctional ADP-dependent (S)-NAD(P)H-hydrate dehydratase/NAD(P)H-hydrate epimerase [Paenibacillus sp. P46E]
MYLVTAEQMRELDRATIERLGIPAVALMENAGRAIAEEIVRFCRERGRVFAGGSGFGHPAVDGGFRAGGANAADGWYVRGMDRALEAGCPAGADRAGDALGDGSPAGADCRNREWDGHTGEHGALFSVSGDAALTLEHAGAEHWLVLVGKGNNGGDGLAAARHLREAGIAVTLVYAAAPESLAGEAALQQNAAAALGLPAVVYGRDRVDFAACSGILDALLGTGSAGAPRGAYAELIAAANGSGKPIVSADIPSGLDADTGQAHEPCIHAAVTVCLAFLKRGLLQYPGAASAGQVVVRSIGIPAALARESGVPASLLTPEVLRTRLQVDVSRRRSPEGHKGTYGHVLVAAGTLSMSGAGLLASRAALRAGCGLVTWALPTMLLPFVIGAAPELMLAAAGGENGAWSAGTAAEVLRLSSGRDVTAVGPGLGRFEGDGEWLRSLWEGIEAPLVIDADALNILADSEYSSWASRRHPVILTPHPGEMARLARLSTAEVQRDRIGLALTYAREHGVILVLKGAHTVIATPEGEAYVNITGHPGMGTGGAGDVLTGMIAGLLAQGLNAAQAAAFGVYLHGLAGERASRLRHDPAALTAGDIIEAL